MYPVAPVYVEFSILLTGYEEQIQLLLFAEIGILP